MEIQTPTLMALSVLQPPPHPPRSDKTQCVRKPSRRRYASGKSRVVYDFSVETLMQYTHLRQADAAKALGVAPITLKRICHRHQLPWPYRAKRRQVKQAMDAAQAMVAMKAVDEAKEEEEEKLRMREPSYTAPVDVPAIKFKQESFSPQRLSLPSLKDALGYRTARVLFPTKELQQPLTEPVPCSSRLPRLNVLYSPSIYQSPLGASELRKKTTVDPLTSPAMFRLGSLPNIQASFCIARAVDSRFSY